MCQTCSRKQQIENCLRLHRAGNYHPSIHSSPALTELLPQPLMLLWLLPTKGEDTIANKSVHTWRDGRWLGHWACNWAIVNSYISAVTPGGVKLRPGKRTLSPKCTSFSILGEGRVSSVLWHQLLHQYLVTNQGKHKGEKVGGKVTNKSLRKASTLGEKWGKSHEDVTTQGMHTGEKVG